MSDVLARLLLEKLGLPPAELDQLESKDAAAQLAQDIRQQRATLDTVNQNINRVIESLLTGAIDRVAANTLLFALQTQLATVKALGTRKEAPPRATTTKATAKPSTSSAAAPTAAAGTATTSARKARAPASAGTPAAPAAASTRSHSKRRTPNARQ